MSKLPVFCSWTSCGKSGYIPKPKSVEKNEMPTKSHDQQARSARENGEKLLDLKFVRFFVAKTKKPLCNFDNLDAFILVKMT